MKMDKVQYTTMESFLLEMQNLNITAGMTGEPWRMKVESKVPSKILERHATLDIPKNDAVWLLNMRTMGRKMEDFDYMLKLQNQGLPAADARGKESQKGTERMAKKGNEAKVTAESFKDRVRRNLKKSALQPLHTVFPITNEKEPIPIRIRLDRTNNLF